MERRTLAFAGPPPARAGAALQDGVAKHYGPFVGWQLLGGEDDLNVRVTSSSRETFLKVSWADAHGFADFQTELIDHLSKAHELLPVPSIVSTVDGHRSVRLDDFDERPVLLRMTTFLAGISVRGMQLEREVLHKLGRVLALLHHSLADFDCHVPDRPTNWNLLQVADVLEGLASVPAKSEDSGLWRIVLDEFVATTLPNLSRWPSQLIHNDINGSNLLVGHGANTITGLVDFGDVVEAPRVIDLAVAAAYLVDGSDVCTMAASLEALLLGYDSLAPLRAEEVAVVPSIMKARHALALTLNHARAAGSDDPEYVAYVLRNAEASRRKLAVLMRSEAENLGEHLLETPAAHPSPGTT